MMTSFDQPIRVIVAVNSDGVIGVEGKIPWRKPEDLKRFKRVTLGSTIIMGRRTWDSLGRRLLPGRRTVVISRTPQRVKTAESLDQAREMARDRFWNNEPGSNCTWTGTTLWVVGGAEVYEQAIPLADEIDLTLVTDSVIDLSGAGVTRLQSFVDGMPGFTVAEKHVNTFDSTLIHFRYTRNEALRR